MCEAFTDSQHAVLRLVHHRREMGDGEARIERVADKASAHRTVIHLEMMLRVPGQRGDPVADAQAQSRQRARQTIAARSQGGVADAPGIRL